MAGETAWQCMGQHSGTVGAYCAYVYSRCPAARADEDGLTYRPRLRSILPCCAAVHQSATACVLTLCAALSCRVLGRLHAVLSCLPPTLRR